jgi:hypothetical protein
MTNSIDQIQTNISAQSSTKLAEMIVCYRYLGLYKEESIMAMEELVKRRESGDQFDFEQYVEEQLAGLPKMDAKKPGFGSLLGMLGKFVGGKR